MPRSGGTMTVPNTFVASTRVLSADVNDNFTDIATELTNSLARDGQAAMLGQFKSLSGTVSAPGMSWGSDLASGWYRAGANDYRYAVAGADVLQVTAAGVTITGDVTVSGTIPLADGAVTTAKIANDAVTADKLADTAVSAGSYTRATITVDAQGRLTAAAAGASELPTQTGNNGKFLTTDGSSASWATNTAYTQPTTLGAVGTYAFLGNTGATVAAGGTAAGSSLRYADSNDATSGTPSGTWQAMGYCTAGFSSLFLRIS